MCQKLSRPAVCATGRSVLAPGETRRVGSKTRRGQGPAAQASDTGSDYFFALFLAFAASETAAWAAASRAIGTRNGEHET
jgi:hypothetical protein